jgi:hypothetical protein
VSSLEGPQEVLVEYRPVHAMTFDLKVATPPPPSVALVQEASVPFGGSGTVTLAYPSDVTAGHLLICLVATSSNSTVSNVSDTVGSTWARTDRADNTGLVVDMELWWAKAAGSGADTVSCTVSGSDNIGLHIMEVSGIVSATPVDMHGLVNTNVAGPVTGPDFNGLASTTDFVVHWALFVPGSNTVTAAPWTTTAQDVLTSAGTSFTQAAWQIAGVNVPGPTLCPGNTATFVLLGAAFHP